MTPSYTLALAASLWTTPGLSPCATDAGNPCWTGPMPTEAGEICDGDLIANTGARDGRMIGPWTQIVALDVPHLIAKGMRFRTREDGATCIPTLTDGAAHLVEACGNRATIIARDSITAVAVSGYMRGGAPSPANTRTWGGASAYVAPPPSVPIPATCALLLGALGFLGAMAIGRRT